MTTAPRRPSTSAGYGAAPGRVGRPVLLLVLWATVLAGGAVIAPLVQGATGMPHEWLSLVMLAPAVASLVVLVVPTWYPRPRWQPAHWRRVMVSALLALAAILAFAAILAVATQRLPSAPFAASGLPVLALLALQALGVLAEEIGWRGVVQRTGEQLAGATVVSAVAGFVFGVTHLGYWGLGPLPVLTFGVAAALMAVTITSIFTGSFIQRMIPAVIVHLGVNVVIASFAVPDEPLATSPFVLVAAAAMLALTRLVKRLRAQ